MSCSKTSTVVASVSNPVSRASTRRFPAATVFRSGAFPARPATTPSTRISAPTASGFTEIQTCPRGGKSARTGTLSPAFTSNGNLSGPNPPDSNAATWRPGGSVKLFAFRMPPRGEPSIVSWA